MSRGQLRIQYIDQAKTIGILLIVLGHISYIYGPVNNTASYFKISIFYIISGLFAYFGDGKREKMVNCMKLLHIKRKTLLIPYCFYSIVALL